MLKRKVNFKRPILKKPVSKKPISKKPISKKLIPKITNKLMIKQLPNSIDDSIQPYQHFIIIRFSLAFAKGNLQKMDYTLNDDRLEKRFKLFENICLPSLINQIKKDNVTVLINITDNMPEKWKNRLHELINDHDFIQIQEFDHRINENLRTCLHNKYLEKYIKPQTKIVATSRLDDDDAFTPNFTNVISKYMKPSYVNHIITLTKGYYFNPINKRCSVVNRSLLAIGLTLIQYVGKYQKFPYGIYSHQHSHWNNLAKCVHVNNVKYIRTVHDTNNSIKNGIQTRVPLNNIVTNLNILHQEFPGVSLLIIQIVTIDPY